MSLAELDKPVTNLQALIWGLMMEAKYGKRDWLELLDETTEQLHDDYILYEYADESVINGGVRSK